MMTAYRNDQKCYEFSDLEDNDDISDDEVFIRDLKHGREEESSIIKPLMAPRRKLKTNKLHTEVRRLPPWRVLCAPVCYGLIALGALMGIICLVIFLVNTFGSKLSFGSLRTDGGVTELIPCSKFEVEDVWIQNFPKLLTESAIRLNDVNSDGVDDVIIGFGTGADGYSVPSFVCDIYFDGTKPCFGGVLALDGKTGVQLWRHYMDHEVFALNCNEDLDDDGIRDCLASGRAGTFQAISCKEGKMLWNFGSQEAKNDIMNVYTAQFISDKNDDGTVDVLAVHGGDPLAEAGSAYRLSGRILILSGKDGKVLRWLGVPDQRESYYSPQVLLHPDGSEIVLFGTGGETHAGALWYITMENLLKGKIEKANILYKDNYKGVMTPPVLVDITGDAVEDIVMAFFNSTVIAFNGLTFTQIWNFTIPSAESYSTPAVGYFNNDNVPDFLIKYQIGPGFPVYYYSQTTILDGRNGRPLLQNPVEDTIGAQASGLTIGFEGFGNDLFLYWTADCLGHEGEKKEFQFLKGTNVHEQSRADFCQLRFNTSLVSRLLALSQQWPNPGQVVYNSEQRKSLEYNNTVNTTQLAIEYVKTHPDVWDLYQKYKGRDEEIVRHPSMHWDRNKGQSRHHLGNGHHKSWSRTQGPRSRHPSYPTNMENEEAIPYPKIHEVHKHGRYKNSHHLNPHIVDNDWDYPLDRNYADYEEQANGPQDLGDLSRENPWMREYSRENNPYLKEKEYKAPTNDWELNGDYDNLRKDYLENNQPYPEDSDLDWNMNLHQGKRYKRTRSNKKIHHRKRRHVGPHDVGGIQRLISTGTLAPPLNITTLHQSIDVIFATYWFFPARTQAILPEDRDCIQQAMAQENTRFDSNSPYYGLDHDAFEETITKECLEKSKSSPNTSNRTYQSQSDYDPFNLHMGQMTVYRLRIKCSCHGDARVEKAGRMCARVLPFYQQGWAAYMGTKADCHYIQRTRH